MSDEINPYEAGKGDVDSTSPRRKFTWWKVPFVIMLILGVPLAIASLWQLVCGLVWFNQSSATASYSLQFRVLAFATLPACAACLWLLAAVYWRRGWWKRALTITLLGYGLLGLTDTITPKVPWPPRSMGF